MSALRRRQGLLLRGVTPRPHRRHRPSSPPAVRRAVFLSFPPTHVLPLLPARQRGAPRRAFRAPHNPHREALPPRNHLPPLRATARRTLRRAFRAPHNPHQEALPPRNHLPPLRATARRTAPSVSRPAKFTMRHYPRLTHLQTPSAGANKRRRRQRGRGIRQPRFVLSELSQSRE